MMTSRCRDRGHRHGLALAILFALIATLAMGTLAPASAGAYQAECGDEDPIECLYTGADTGDGDQGNSDSGGGEFDYCSGYCDDSSGGGYPGGYDPSNDPCAEWGGSCDRIPFPSSPPGSSNLPDCHPFLERRNLALTRFSAAPNGSEEQADAQRELQAAEEAFDLCLLSTQVIIGRTDPVGGTAGQAMSYPGQATAAEKRPRKHRGKRHSALRAKSHG